MTRGGKEMNQMMEGPWRRFRGMAGKRDVRDALDQSHYSELLSQFSNLVNSLDIPQ